MKKRLVLLVALLLLLPMTISLSPSLSLKPNLSQASYPDDRGSPSWCLSYFCWQATDACTGTRYASYTGLPQGVCVILPYYSYPGDYDSYHWRHECDVHKYMAEYCNNISPTTTAQY